MGMEQDRQKIALIKCKTICDIKKSEELRIKDITYINKALLGRWKWRLGKEEKGLWRYIIM